MKVHETTTADLVTKQQAISLTTEYQTLVYTNSHCSTTNTQSQEQTSTTDVVKSIFKVSKEDSADVNTKNSVTEVMTTDLNESPTSAVTENYLEIVANQVNYYISCEGF